MNEDARLKLENQEIELLITRDKFKRVRNHIGRIVTISAIYVVCAISQNRTITTADTSEFSANVTSNVFANPVVENSLSKLVITGNELPRQVSFINSRADFLENTTAFKEISLIPTGADILISNAEKEIAEPKLTLEAQTAPPPWEPSDEFATHQDVQVEPPRYVTELREKTMYLTFDDGPSDVTIEILDILAEHGIKGTFFVTCQSSVQSSEKYIAVLNRIVDEGHTLAAHTYTHEYSIYNTIETFLDDFSLIFNHIKDATGVTPDIFRFAGGSRNSFNRHLADELIDEMNSRGFVFYDWNVSNDDSVGRAQTSQDLVNNVKNTFNNSMQEIVLMHDLGNKQNTAASLDDIISFGIEQGYKFDKLTNNVPPIQF